VVFGSGEAAGVSLGVAGWDSEGFWSGKGTLRDGSESQESSFHRR
jgi:hypothetical protein